MVIFKDLEINDRIRDREVRVIDEDGKQLGIMSPQEALKLADQKNLDLVKVAPNANPPVCKIMDYGKYRFEAAKKEKENRKNQKVSELKEIWLSMTIDKHDLETKARQAAKFIKNGDKVKVSIRMRGRQQAYSDIGVEVMERFYELLKDVAVIEKNAYKEGRSIIMMLAPIKAAK
ncbi:MAG TPA: translation initiation factor IF-3 [Clostridia bacterium]